MSSAGLELFQITLMGKEGKEMLVSVEGPKCAAAATGELGAWPAGG